MKKMKEDASYHGKLFVWYLSVPGYCKWMREKIPQKTNPLETQYNTRNHDRFFCSTISYYHASLVSITLIRNYASFVVAKVILFVNKYEVGSAFDTYVKDDNNLYLAPNMIIIYLLLLLWYSGIIKLQIFRIVCILFVNKQITLTPYVNSFSIHISLFTSK